MLRRGHHPLLLTLFPTDQKGILTMKQRQMRTSRRIAFCGIMAALTLVLLYLGSMTVLDLSAVILCALLTMLVVVECGKRAAWITIAAAGVLALLIVPYKTLAVLYIFMGGIYPILKAIFERLRPVFAWLFKLSFLDSMLLAVIALSKLVFTAEEPFFDFSWLVLLFATVFFVVFDLALTSCITLYITKLRRRLGLGKLF